MQFPTRKLALSLAVICGLFTGCDDGGAIQSTTSNDIIVQPSIEFTRDEFKGGWVGDKVKIQHGGTLALKIKDLYFVVEDPEDPSQYPRALEGCDRVSAGISPGALIEGDLAARCIFMIDERPELPFELENSGFRDVAVSFRDPDQVTPPTTYLVIESNNLQEDLSCPSSLSERGTRCVKLIVATPTPRIRATPTVVAFANAEGRDDITVTNEGSGPLRVESALIALLTPPATDPQTGEPVPEFKISTTADLPWTIESQGSQSFRITYTPIDDIEDRAQLVLKSNDPQNPEYIIDLTSASATGILNITPNPVTFGAVEIGGRTVSKQVSLTNIGLGTVFVLDIAIGPDDAEYSYGGQTSFQLAAGAAKELNIGYTPRSMEGSDATMTVKWRDSNGVSDVVEEVQLVRSAASLPAILAVDPARADFSNVAEGASESMTFTLTNSGGSPLEISAIRLSDDDDLAGPPGAPATDAEFGLTGGDAETLAPGDSKTVEVEFSRAAGDRNARVGALIIESNADSSPDVIFFTANPPPR